MNSQREKNSSVGESAQTKHSHAPWEYGPEQLFWETISSHILKKKSLKILHTLWPSMLLCTIQPRGNKNSDKD